MEEERKGLLVLLADGFKERSDIIHISVVTRSLNIAFIYVFKPVTLIWRNGTGLGEPDRYVALTERTQ